jgi:hypothetical protein
VALNAFLATWANLERIRAVKAEYATNGQKKKSEFGAHDRLGDGVC